MASSKKKLELKQLSSKKSLSSEEVGENPASISEINLAVISKTNLVTAKFESNKNRERQKSPTNS